MNKLKWFTHDNDALQDLDIRKVMSEHGGLKAYGLWWALLELLDLHGKGDVVTVSWLDLCRVSMSTRRYIHPTMQELHTMGLICISAEYQDYISYEIKKHRERQAKMKSNTPARLPQDSRKTPLEREGEREGEREREEKKKQITTKPIGIVKVVDKGYSATFEAVWQHFIRKVGKDEAAREWKKAGLAAKYLDVIQAVKRYNQTPAVKKGMIMNPAKWIKNGHWQDETSSSTAATDYQRLKEISDKMKKTYGVD